MVVNRVKNYDVSRIIQNKDVSGETIEDQQYTSILE